MKFFKMQNWKRLVILSTTIVGAILTILLGSIFYVTKPDNVRKSAEYGGEVRYTVQINSSDPAISSQTVAESIYERIDALGVGGTDITTGHASNGKPTVTVGYSGLTTQSQKDEVQHNILHKPQLAFTDVYGNPLFNKYGKFDSRLSGDPKGTIAGFDASTFNWETGTKVPLASDGAKETFDQMSGNWKISISLKDQTASTEWTKATAYVSNLPNGKNLIVSWLDPGEFVHKLQNHKLYKGNIFQDAYVSSGGILRKHTVNASDYLISAASVSQALSGKQFVLEGSFSRSGAEKIAKQLNFGSASYNLKLLSKLDYGSTYGQGAFQKAIIAGIVVLSLIAIFLIANYGLLGALSTISISLFVFLTLLMFTIMRGEYSPESIAALIIGIGMSVDANIITFERLKTEVYKGANLNKATKRANRGSLSSIFDANITTLIVAFVLFYFGTKSIRGLSVTLIISIFFTLVIMLGFTRIMSTQLIRTGKFEDKRYWLGIRPKFDKATQAKLNKPDYIKMAKPFSAVSTFVITMGVIIFALMAGIAGSITGGMNFSKEFTGGSAITIQAGTAEKPKDITRAEFDAIKTELINHNVKAEDIYYKSNALIVDSTTDYSVEVAKASLNGNADKIKVNNATYHVSSNIVTNEMAKQLVKDAMYAIMIAIILIVIYTLIRFKWTYSFAAIVALVHDGLIVTAVFTLVRVEVSPVFVAGILSVLGYSINDTIVTFDRIRERMNNHTGELNKVKIKNIANDAIKDTIKRSLLTSFTTIIAIVVLMSFGNATKFAFNLSMLIGLMAGTYSSIFIATYIWNKLEVIRQKGIVQRQKKGFWKTKGVEEQTFKGINDFKA